MNPIIEINNLGKKYPIIHDKVQYGTLRDSVVNFAKHPFTRGKTHEDFWALKDVNLSIEKGDIVGIIGKNGAGKSTLLKIIAGITKPTEGNIKLYGRVSSLLEVGTGFHPELTGRENIFLNGVILGMTRKEVAKKFDQIVDFAGIEKFLDTPVKHYSSGMYVRLAFAVAAHLEPDILIIDEVLAVGDAEFQKKCLGKMGEISRDEGRTVIFVSHNMGAIQQLCNVCTLITDGKIQIMDNNVDNVISEYNNTSSNSKKLVKWIKSDDSYDNDLFSPIELHISNNNDERVDSDLMQDKEYFVNITCRIEKTNAKMTIGYALYSENGSLLFWSYQTDTNVHNILKKGKLNLKSKIPLEILNGGHYMLELIGGVHNEKWLFEPETNTPKIYFYYNKLYNSTLFNAKRPGLLSPAIDWRIENV